MSSWNALVSTTNRTPNGGTPAPCSARMGRPAPGSPQPRIRTGRLHDRVRGGRLPAALRRGRPGANRGRRTRGVPDDDGWRLRTTMGEMWCRMLVVATGNLDRPSLVAGPGAP